jgi:uroporphyrinogen-III synthase
VLVVLTGARGGLAGLTEALVAAGHTVVERPLILFAPPENWTPFDAALTMIDSFAAVAVTSPRAAEALAARLPRPPARVPVWTGGHRTASPLQGIFQTIHVAPDLGRGAAESVADEMRRARVSGPVLFPCGTLRRETLPHRLEAAGIRVESIVCYRTLLEPAEAARTACRDGDVLIVTSPSVATLLAETGLTERPRLLAVGPTTAHALAARGWPPDAVAGTAAVAAVMDGITRLSDGAPKGR